MTRIICFEGTDGTGKTVQMELLASTLRKRGNTVECRSFPVYESFFGKQLGAYLSSNTQLPDSKSMALWYALDRWLDFTQNKTAYCVPQYLLLNRYTLSSEVFQGIRGSASETVMEWICCLEHQILGLPEPDIYLVLDLDPRIARRNNEAKGARDYISHSLDVYENDADLQLRARAMYVHLANIRDNVRFIPCCTDSGMRNIDDIAEDILSAVVQSEPCDNVRPR